MKFLLELLHDLKKIQQIRGIQLSYKIKQIRFKQDFEWINSINCGIKRAMSVVSKKFCELQIFNAEK